MLDGWKRRLLAAALPVPVIAASWAELQSGGSPGPFEAVVALSLVAALPASVRVRLPLALAMLVGLLGIVKSGGAYLPLDPSYPQERLEWILADAGVQLVLTEEYLAQAEKEIAQQSKAEPASNHNGDNLAYLIYTSGSTGWPKGVQVTLANLVNFLGSMQAEPGLTADDTLVAVTTLSFDIAGLELYLPLISGGRVVLADSETATDGHRLLKLLRERRATLMPLNSTLMSRSAGWAISLSNSRATACGPCSLLILRIEPPPSDAIALSTPDS